MSDASQDVLLVDADKAALMLSVSKRLIWAMAQSGEIPCVRLGRRVLYDPADLKAWVAAKKTRGDATAAAVD